MKTQLINKMNEFTLKSCMSLIVSMKCQFRMERHHVE